MPSQHGAKGYSSVTDGSDDFGGEALAIAEIDMAIGPLYARYALVLGLVVSGIVASWCAVLPVYLATGLQMEFQIGPGATALASSLTFVAWAISAPSCGALSDSWGRRPALITFLLLATVASLAGAASPVFFVYGLSRLAMGAALAGAVQTSFVFLLEVVLERE